jgi:hypothetical protein
MENDGFLDYAQDQFDLGNGCVAMRTIVDGLTKIRLQRSSNEWRDYVNAVSQHQGLTTTRLCPFTRHAASRPYGYPGDARLIDVWA